MASLSTIFSWFEMGDVPTQQQFQETFSSFYHKESKIPFLQVEGLESAFENVASADSINTITQDLGTRAKSDASNLTPDQIISWKEALEIVNIAVVDSAPDVYDGNVYSKLQINEIVTTLHNRDDTNASLIEEIKNTLASDDINLDELQEVVNYIKENREDIEALQAVVIGQTTDDKVNLIDDYPLFGTVETQQQLNIEFYRILTETKTSAIVQINGSATFPNPLETSNVIIQARDSITGKRMNVDDYASNTNIQINLLDDLINPINILIQKIEA